MAQWPREYLLMLVSQDHAKQAGSQIISEQTKARSATSLLQDRWVSGFDSLSCWLRLYSIHTVRTHVPRTCLP